MSAPFKFLIDWNGDSDYGDTGEDVSAVVDGPAGVHWSRGKDQIKQFAPAVAGQAGFTLFNLSRDYSPGNASSPIAGLVLPGRKVRIETIGTAGDGFSFEDAATFEFEDGTAFELEGGAGRIAWSGFLDEIAQDPVNRRVGLLSLGALSRLRGKSLSTALYQNITTAEALIILLDAAGWPAGERTIQTGLTIMDWWWLAGEDAFNAAEALRATEGPGASLYEDPSGYIVFENRDSRTTQTRSTVSQATFEDTTNITGLAYNPNFKDAIEAATMTVQERRQAGQTVIWQLGSTLTLAASEIRQLQIPGSDPFTGAVIPSAAPSDTVQTLTGDVAFTAGTFKLKFRDEVAAAAINWNATAAQVQTSLVSITTIGSGNVTCNGGPISTTPVSVAFTGVFAGLAITDLIETVEGTLNPIAAPATIEVTEDFAGNGILSERQTLRPSASLTAGTFVINMPVEYGFTTSSIAYNASAATIQTAIRTSGSWGSVTCTGGPMSSGLPVAMNLIYSSDLSMADVVGTGLMCSVGTGVINVAITTQGGVPDYVLTAGAISFVLDRTSGALITLTATAGAVGATLTGLQLRASPVPVIRTHHVSFPEDVAVIPSGKIYNISTARAEIPLTFAREYVEMFVNFYSRPRATIPFAVTTSIYSATIDALLQREVSDLITIVEAQTGINNLFYIEQVSHSIVGLTLVSEFGCEQMVNLAAVSPLSWY